MKKLILTLFFLKSLLALSQADNYFNPIPDSPTISNLGKYIDFPISLYTGQSDISIPIYNLTIKDINVPISLKYHTGGIRVEEIASSVGLGWSLIANGTINRRVNGSIDGVNSFFYKEPGTYELDSEYFNIHKNSASGGVDTEHDYFNYSAGTYTGKYIIDYKNGNSPVQFPVQDVKIENKKITTPDGLIYTYGLTEYNRTFTTCDRGKSTSMTGNPTSKPNTWFLTEIKSQTSDVRVEFIYQLKSLEYEQNGTQTLYKNIVGGSRYDTNCTILNRIVSQRLTSIVAYDGQSEVQRINFNYGDERADLKNDYLLSEITIVNSQSVISKKIKLYHKYLNGGNFHEISDYNSDTILNERLRLVLTGVQEIGNNNEELPPYTFEYNISGQGLPSRRSYSQDYWGYYNGVSNKTLVPSIMFEDELLAGADKKPNFKYAVQGTLSKINFPTGGSKTLTYELNTCANCSFLNYTTVGNSQIKYESHLIGDNDYYLSNKQSLVEKYFEVEGQKDGEIIMDMATETSYWGESYSSGREIELKLYSLNDDNTINETIFDSNGSQHIEGLDEDEINGLSVKIDHTFSGKYKLELKVNNHEWASSQDTYYLQVKWLIPLSIADYEYYDTAGGLRTKKIDLYDPVKNKITHRSYSYEKGALSGFQSYARRVKYVLGTSPLIYGSAISRTSTPILSLSNTKGGVVGYGKVTVKEEGNGFTESYYYTAVNHPDKGYSEENYSSILDVPTNGIGVFDVVRDTQDWYYPFCLNDEKDWKRGLLKEKYIYKEGGGLLKKIKNNYSFYDDPKDPSYDINKVYTVRGSRTNSELAYTVLLGTFYPLEFNLGKLSINFYSLESSWYDINEVIETNYFDNGEELTTTTKYEYSPNQRTIKKITATSSDNKIIEKESLYPSDYSNTDLGSDLLRSKNMLHFPLKERTIVNNIITSEKRNNYTLKDSLIGLSSVEYLPHDIDTGIKTNFLRDIKGNIIEVKKAEGISIFYIWGYNGTYPIAKIEKFKSSQVTTAIQSLITEAEDASNLDVDREVDVINSTTGVITYQGSEGDLREALQELREELPNDAMVTTYTYDPLIGLTSVTDPRGNTTYYEYDDFNRLKQVIDAEGNILSENEYKYKQ